MQIGILLKKAYWHKGYATEGAAACLKYGFELFYIPQILVTIRPENTASIAVVERLGMKLMGEYDKGYNGKIMKYLIYGINRSEVIRAMSKT